MKFAKFFKQPSFYNSSRVLHDCDEVKQLLFVPRITWDIIIIHGNIATTFVITQTTLT